MWLIDTNVISELCRRQPDAKVVQWATAVSDFRLSVISVEEITYGLAWRPNPRILEWMEGFFMRHPILSVTCEIAEHAGRIRGRLAAEGRARTQADMLIAATAAVHDLTLVTRNYADFEGCGIRLLNPFQS